MAEIIVDEFEIIDIKNCYGSGFEVVLFGIINDRLEPKTVVKPCQRVVITQELILSARFCQSAF